MKTRKTVGLRSSSFSLFTKQNTILPSPALMAFLEIFLKFFKNLTGLLMTCFNTSSHDDGGDEEQTKGASSSSTPPKQNYEVFLSFRGGDTRHCFTDHLYHGLKNRRIEVFRDSEELHVGEKIDQLFEAIKASKISILIISPDYASGIWCLRELLQILECRKTLGQLVLPIFYHVKPSDVRELKGNFGEKFRQCKRKHNLGREFVRELENAFEEVANIKVWEVNETENSYEGELVEKVVTKIFSELRKAVLRVPNFLVGVEDHVKEIKKRINAKPSHDAKIIGIHGMGGIGKTTLAKVLYNVLCNDFECRSFVPNIREASKNYKGIEGLQKQIISDILDYKLPQEIPHVDQGITIIENSFKGKRILLLLDDVENKEQLNKLVAKNSWLESQSIVIITTRNKDVTVASAVNLSYELSELNYDQSYELFCNHAFGKDASCPWDLETLARKIIFTTGGLPLAVDVIGSLLYQKDEDFWKETLQKLRRVSNKKVRDQLKISYDYLEYGQQQIFLDIACLSLNFDRKLEYSSCMWKSCGFYPKEGIERLMSLSLIKWDDRLSRITIHDQLRDLGREIVQKEGCDNIGLCSRIWLKEEAMEVIERKQGTHKLQALILRTESDELHYTSEDFEGMPNLRFLEMGNVHLTGDFEKLFLNLRWLQWGHSWSWGHSPRKDVMGINFNPKKLVFLELNNSNVTEHWKGWSYMEHLKVIRLMQCQELTTTPDFSALKEIEVLCLVCCLGLKKIHPSIGKLSKTLKVFEAIGCSDLHDLPIELGKMEELRGLDISDTSIREIPISKGCMTKLETLTTSHCGSLLYIPDSLGSLVKLQRLYLYKCKSVTKIPESIGRLRLLTMLNLANTGIEELPDSIGELCNLESLWMDKTPVKCLPTSIGMLSKLRDLGLSGCTKLKSLPNLPSSLTTLLFNGESMETLPDLSNLINLKYLKYRDLFERRNRALNLGYLNQLEDLWIEHQDFLDLRRKSQVSDPAEEFDMAPDNFSLKLELPVSLLMLEVCGCQTLHTLPNFSNFKNLSKLRLMDCSELVEINGIGGAESLKDLVIERCRKLSRLGNLSHLKVLRAINLSDCDKLSDVQGIEKSMSLTSLIFARCYPKIKFLDLSLLTNLKVLTIEDKEPREILGLQELKSLGCLDISECHPNIKFLHLSMLTNLEVLRIEDKELMEIPGLQELKSLERLDISGCKSLQHLPDLSQCTKLKQLVVEGCEKLIDIRGLENLRSLMYLDIRGCFALSNLPFLPNVKIKSDPLKEEEGNSGPNSLESKEEKESDPNLVEENE